MLYVENAHLEEEERGETTLELVTVTYKGHRSSQPIETIRTQGRWPGHAPLLKDQPRVALVPDDGLAYIESSQHFDVSYDPEDIATAMLNTNYLPSNVFGRSFDARVQDHVREKLDIEFKGMANEEGNREELRKVAGESPDKDGTKDTNKTRVQELTDNHTRNELLDVATDLGMSAEDTEKTSVTSALKKECAEFLAEQDDQSKVNDALADKEE